MSQFSTFLVLAICVLACLQVTIGHKNEILKHSQYNEAHAKPHGNIHMPAKPIRPAHHINKYASSSYSDLMAYHEEPTRPPRPIYEAQWDVEDFHSSGAYDTEMENVLSNAILYAQNTPAQNNSVWVFDVDETSLSGYTEMLSIGFGYVAKINHAWVLNASAPALPQTLQLYQTVIANGFRVIFLTGRHDDEHDATAQNLVSVGFTTFDAVVTRDPTEFNLTATVYKSNRRTQFVEEQGYDVVGCVGDQWSDLHGPYTGYKVKLPNYIYYIP